MKSFLLKSLLSLLISPVVLAQSVQHKLVFDKPMTLTANQVGIRVEKIESNFDKSKNTWVVRNPSDKVYYCDINLNIEGRDLATKNPILNEHYFGSMQVNCPQGAGFSWKPFSTKISRVMIMGIRNCIESETMRDQDYCDVVVMSLQKESDLNTKTGDLAEQTKDKKVYYRIHSKDAQKRIIDLNLMPEGVNAETLIAYQLFPLSIAAKGNEFFVRNEGNYSNLPSGTNIYLKADTESSERDNQISQKVQEHITNLERILKDLQTSNLDPAKVNTKFPTYISEFSLALKTLLAMVSPTEFRRLELQLRGIENQMIELVKSTVDSVTDRDSFVNNYAGKFTDFQSLAGYLNGRNTVINYKRLLDASAKESDIVDGTGRPKPNKSNESGSEARTAVPSAYPTITTSIDLDSKEGDGIGLTTPRYGRPYVNLNTGSGDFSIHGDGGNPMDACRQFYYTYAKSESEKRVNEYGVWLGGDKCSILYVKAVDSKYHNVLSERTLGPADIANIERVFVKRSTNFVLYRTVDQNFKLVVLPMNGELKAIDVTKNNINQTIEQYAQ